MAAGNATVWKPAPSTPLCAVATTKIVASVLEKNGIPGALVALVNGGKDVGEAIIEDAGVDMGISSSSSPQILADTVVQSPSPAANTSAARSARLCRAASARSSSSSVATTPRS
jgi:delta 1-pyrroline-5-carboxylate dehydrogenase